MFKEYNKCLKQTKTLKFVIDAIEKDLDKISKKSKEYRSMNIRKTNLEIVVHKNCAKIHQFYVEILRCKKFRNYPMKKKVSAS